MDKKIYDITEPLFETLIFNDSFESKRKEPLSSGNHADFSSIYAKFYPFAFFFARKFVSAEDAADIVSCIFTKFLLQKKSFTNLAHVKASLRVSVKNECFSHLLNKSRRIRRETGWHYSEYEHMPEGDYNKEEIGAEKLVRIYNEIEKLAPRCKKVFQLAYLDNLKNDEIARLLGVSIFTVKNQKSYALKIIRMGLLTLLSFLQFYSFTW